MTWRDCDRIADRAESDGTLAGLRDAALVRVMSDALLRVSEAAALDVADVAQPAADIGTVDIRRSKTDQEARGSVHSIGPETLATVRAWCEAAGISEGPLFRHVDKGGNVRGRLSVQSLRLIVKRRAGGVPSLKGRAVSGHSLRIGAAQSLAEAGATLPEMMQSGRWKNPEMPAHYSRLQRAGQDAVARLRYRR